MQSAEPPGAACDLEYGLVDLLGLYDDGSTVAAADVCCLWNIGSTGWARRTTIKWKQVRRQHCDETGGIAGVLLRYQPQFPPQPRCLLAGPAIGRRVHLIDTLAVYCSLADAQPLHVKR